MRSGSAFGITNGLENAGASGGLIVDPSLQSSCVKYGQRSGKAFFGRKSAAGDDIPSSETGSNVNERKKLEELIDSVWPKDPLAEQQLSAIIGNDKD